MNTVLQMKTCTKCGAEKPLDQFNRCGRSRDGHRGACRVCSNAPNAAYYAANRERALARSAAWHTANRDRRATAVRVWRAANREHHNATARTWRRLNRERLNARMRVYSASARGVAKGLRSSHGLDGPTSERWAAVLMAPDARCTICGIVNWCIPKLGMWKVGGPRLNRRLSLDHVTPGVNDGNYRPLCLSCNRTRGANQRTDAQVLAIMRRWYEARFAPRRLWWLNTRAEGGVAVGGRAHREVRPRFPLRTGETLSAAVLDAR